MSDTEVLNDNTVTEEKPVVDETPVTDEKPVLTEEQKAAIAANNAAAVKAIFNNEPKRYELTPIGVYGDYSDNPDKCSWYFVEGGTLYLFDCPFSNVRFVMSKEGQKVMSKVDKVLVFITSLKESRVGGLKTTLDVLLSMDMPHLVYFPLPIWITGCNYLEVVGADMKDSHIIRGEYYQDDNVQIFPREVVHDGMVKTFAYMVYGGDLFINPSGTNWSVYYSPDNRVFMDDSVLRSFIADPREKTIYHGVSLTIDDETHCYKDRITQAVPKKLRDHIYPMYFNKPTDANKFKTLGFNVK